MLKRLPRLLAVALLGASFAAACSGDPEQRKREYLESGNRYFEQKLWAEAIIEYRNAIQIDPGFGDARYKLSEALIQSGDVLGAAGELVRSAELLPTRVDVQLRAGNVLLLSGRFDEAKARAERVLRVEPRNVSGQILRGNALAGLKEFQSALSEIQAAIELEPERSASYTALGSVQFARGQMDEAESAFKLAVELDRRSANAHLALATFYWTSNRLPEAEAAFRQALEIEPANQLANRALATFYLASNRVADAEPYLRSLAESGQDATNRLALADYYVMTRRFDDALRSLEPIRADAEQGVDSTLRVASIRHLQGQRAEAHRLLDEVLAKSPNRPDALIAKARFLLAEEKLPEALSAATKAAGADPGAVRAHYLVGTIQASLKRNAEARKAFSRVLELNPRAVVAQVRVAELELAAGNPSASLQHAQDAVIAQPQNAQARLILAKSHLAEANLPSAERELTALGTTYPKWAAVHTQLGLLRLRQRDTARARRSFETAMQLDPTSAEALAGLVALDIRSEKPGEARARLDARLATSPSDVGTLIMGARGYMLMKDYAKAEELLTTALQRDPSELRVYGDLARLYVVTGRLDEARQKLESMGSKDPAVATEANTMAAVILQVQNRNEEAQKKYESVIASNRESAVAANNLAWMYAERGEHLDRALELALTAKRLLPRQPAVSDTLGFVYLKRSAPELAAPVLREAVEQDPENVRYRLRLGIALARAGRDAEARTELELGLRANPDFPEVAEARSALEGLAAAARKSGKGD